MLGSIRAQSSGSFTCSVARTGPSFEMFAYERRGRVPEGAGITVQGEPTTTESGPSKGLTWVYLLSPWNMQLELVSYPVGMAALDDDPGALWLPKDS
jgi:hypothetical protein